MPTIEQMKQVMIQQLEPHFTNRDFAEKEADAYFAMIKQAFTPVIEAEVMADFDSRLKKLVTTTHELYYSYAQNKYCLSPPDDPWFVSGETIMECVEKAEKAMNGEKEG